MIDNSVCKCTRCGRSFTDLRIEISLGMYVSRLKESGVWEGIANLDQTSTEILCPACFDEFAQVLSQLNIPYIEKTKVPEPASTDCECTASNVPEPAVEEDCTYVEQGTKTN